MIDRQDLLQSVRGLLIGSADIVPGVSGGTVALILGIYTRLVTAISHFDLTALRLLLAGRLRDFAARVDLRFLAFLGLGIGTGIVGLATTMNYLLEHHLERALAAFFGMILASSLIVGRMVGAWNPRRIVGLVVGLLFAYWLVGLPFLRTPPDSLAYLFFCGAVAICAMILPGISGAFLLLILGKYHELTGVLRDLAAGRFGFESLTIVAVFAAGAAVGILSFSRLLRWLLATVHGATMAVLTGLMLGSLRRIWPFKTDLTPEVHDFKSKDFENRLPTFDDEGTWISLLVMVLAAGLVLALERISLTRTEAEPA